MKNTILTVFFLFFALASFAQGTNMRRIMFHTFAKDSIVLALNNEYYLIEDDCAQIIRYGHYNFTDRIFTGKFKDVSKQDTTLVVSEGTYNTDGQRDGPFIARYLNGNLRARGNFKANTYDGSWQMFYENGKPDVYFEVADGQYTIKEAWKPDGTKIVDNGNGTYINDMKSMYWKGKLANGKPDGSWHLVNANSGNTLFTERFKKGVFEDGANEGSTYTYSDKSHIQFISFFKMPFINVENMSFSLIACNGAGLKHVANAQHKDGSTAFAEEIKQLVEPFFKTVNLKELDNSFVIEGEISAAGLLTNMHSTQSFREDLARGVINRLKNMRDITPATVDGKPVSQKFAIKFVFTDSVYQFSYRLYPVDIK